MVAAKKFPRNAYPRRKPSSSAIAGFPCYLNSLSSASDIKLRRINLLSCCTRNSTLRDDHYLLIRLLTHMLFFCLFGAFILCCINSWKRQMATLMGNRVMGETGSYSEITEDNEPDNLESEDDIVHNVNSNQLQFPGLLDFSAEPEFIGKKIVKRLIWRRIVSMLFLSSCLLGLAFQEKKLLCRTRENSLVTKLVITQLLLSLVLMTLKKTRKLWMITWVVIAPSL